MGAPCWFLFATVNIFVAALCMVLWGKEVLQTNGLGEPREHSLPYGVGGRGGETRLTLEHRFVLTNHAPWLQASGVLRRG